MDSTPWLSYYQSHTGPEQRIADYESHLHMIKGLDILQNWLRNCYLMEATVEWRHLKLYLMQVRTPLASASPMQVGTPVASLQRIPGHAFATEEALLQWATLLCSPQQEAYLLNPLLTLTDYHIKMMDALHHLDFYSLQFICKSAEALHRERMPTQVPPGYCMLQASDTLPRYSNHGT